MAKYHPPDEPLLSLEQFCELFHVSPATLLTWNKKYRFPINKVRKGRTIIPHEFHLWAKINAFKQSRRHPYENPMKTFITFRSLSLAARGLMLELIALALRSPDPQVLRLSNGYPIPPESLHQMIGTGDDLNPLFYELERADLLRRVNNEIHLLPVPGSCEKKRRKK